MRSWPSALAGPCAGNDLSPTHPRDTRAAPFHATPFAFVVVRPIAAVSVASLVVKGVVVERGGASTASLVFALAVHLRASGGVIDAQSLGAWVA